ncbi:MAG: DUF2147 domain-containing protein [Bacteroidetes bacterium]|nr:DUF2147 domain-containing protein [Bacteroidota bacterium]
MVTQKLIYKKDNKCHGKIARLREPNEEDGKPKLDDENRMKQKQSQPIMGLVILKKL